MRNRKIKVLHVIGIMDYGGAETMIMNLYRKINKEEFQFDFLVHRNRIGQYDKEIKDLGGNIYYIPEFKIYNWKSYKKACVDFFSKHNDYDIVHGHIESCAEIYLNAANEQGICTVAHCHSAGFQSLIPKLLYNFLTHNTRNVSNYFLACSQEAGENRFGNNVVNSARFLIFNNGIDTEKYVYTEERHNTLKKEWNVENKRIIGHVGRMSQEKNQRFLLEIFKKICSIQNNVELFLVGDGQEKEALEKQAKDLNISENVRFLGSRSDVADLMNLFDVFVFPSIYEGLPLVLVEAQAADLPCVVSEAIVSEAIFTDKIKKLSLNDSHERWVTEVLALLNRNDMRNDNYALICEKGFDINDTVMRLEEFYKSIIKK